MLQSSSSTSSPTLLPWHYHQIFDNKNNDDSNDYDKKYNLQKHHVKDEPMNNNHYDRHYQHQHQYDSGLRWYESEEYNIGNGVVMDDILEAYIEEKSSGSSNGKSKNKNIVSDNEKRNDNYDETYKLQKQYVKEDPIKNHYNQQQQQYDASLRWYESEEYNIGNGVVMDDILEAYIEEMSSGSSNGKSKNKNIVSDNEKRNDNYDETYSLQKQYVKEDPIKNHYNQQQQHYDASLRWYESEDYHMYDGIVMDNILEAYIEEMSSSSSNDMNNKNKTTSSSSDIEKKRRNNDRHHDQNHYYYDESTTVVTDDDILYAYYYQETSRKKNEAAMMMSNDTTTTTSVVLTNNDDGRRDMLPPLVSLQDDKSVIVETSIMVVGGLITLITMILLMRQFVSPRRQSDKTNGRVVTLPCSNKQKTQGKRKKKRRRKNKNQCRDTIRETMTNVDFKEEDCQPAHDDALTVINDHHNDQKRQKRNDNHRHEGVIEDDMSSIIPNEEESLVTRDDAIMDTSSHITHKHNHHSHEAISTDSENRRLARHQNQTFHHHLQPINNSIINAPPPNSIIHTTPNDNPLLTTTTNNNDYLSTVHSLSHALSLTGLSSQTSLQIAHESILRRWESERTLSLYHELEMKRKEDVMKHLAAIMPQRQETGVVRIWWKWVIWCLVLAVGGRVGVSCYGVYRKEGLGGCILLFIDEICQCHKEDVMETTSSTISSSSTMSMTINYLSSLLLPTQSSSPVSRLIDVMYCYTPCLSKHLASLVIIYLTHQILISFKCHDMFHHVVNVLAVGLFVMTSFRQVALWEIVVPVGLVNGVAGGAMMGVRVVVMNMVVTKGEDGLNGDAGVESMPLKMRLSIKGLMWRMEVVLKCLSLVISLVMGMGVEALKELLYEIVIW